MTLRELFKSWKKDINILRDVITQTLLDNKKLGLL